MNNLKTKKHIIKDVTSWIMMLHTDQSVTSRPRIRAFLICVFCLIALSVNAMASDNDYIVLTTNPLYNLRFVDNNYGNLNISVDVIAYYFPLHYSQNYNTSVFVIKNIQFDLVHENSIINKINNRIAQKGSSVGYNVTKIIRLDYNTYYR